MRTRYLVDLVEKWYAQINELAFEYPGRTCEKGGIHIYSGWIQPDP